MLEMVLRVAFYFIIAGILLALVMEAWGAKSSQTMSGAAAGRVNTTRPSLLPW